MVAVADASVVAVGVQGWGRVETLRSPGRAFNQAFVAMSFETELLAVYDAANQSRLSLVPFDEHRLPSPVHRPAR